MKTDVVVIGGGPAGMQTALSASKQGAKVILIERNEKLGGILNQCIHNGFGLHYFKEELTGPEYAYKFVKLVNQDKNIKVLLNTFVTSVQNKKVEIISNNGVQNINCKSVVFAVGCRERTAGNIYLAGTRPVGIYTAGLAQRMVNIEGKLPGKKVLILGSGDIGLIMARRLTFEGAKVLGVLEINKTTSGLKRNIVQCLDDFDIPLYLSTTISEVVGTERVCGAYICNVDENYNLIESTKKFIECDCIILSVGLIPETELLQDYNINNKTNSVFVDDTLQFNNGMFACGNFLHVHDLVDNVTYEACDAGKFAALYAQNQLNNIKYFNLEYDQNISYAIPSKIGFGNGEIKIKFRVKNKILNSKVQLICNNEIIFEKFFMAIAPGEMQIINIDKQNINGDIKLIITNI